jgi:hypothetical protein
MATTTHAPKSVTPDDRAARQAAGLLGECLDTYEHDAEIAAAIATTIAELERIARRRARAVAIRQASR